MKQSNAYALKKKAHKRLLELLDKHLQDHNQGQPINYVGIIEVCAPEAGQYMLSTLKERYDADMFMVSTFSPVLGTHSGPGTLGIGAIYGFDEAIIR